MKEEMLFMAKCPQPQLHKTSWRIKSKDGDKRTIYCLVCDFEWESKSNQYEHLPKLTEEEKKIHLIGKYD
jgi:hypothetical protein